MRVDAGQIHRPGRASGTRSDAPAGELSALVDPPTRNPQLTGSLGPAA